MAGGDRAWPLHKEALSFILLNISRLPDDYLVYSHRIEETILTAYENEIRKQFIHCPAESQGSCNYFNVIVAGSSVEGLCMDNIIHYPSMLDERNRQMEETDLDCMMIDKRFVAAEKLDGDGNLQWPMRLGLETAKHRPGYASLIIDKRVYNEAVREGKDQQAQDAAAVFTNYAREKEGEWFFASELYSATQLQRINSVNQEMRGFYKHGPALSITNEESVSLDVITHPKKAKTTEILSVSGFDIVPALEVEEWPEVSAGWGMRERHWPEQDAVKGVMRNKCHLVPVPHHQSTCPEIEWRLSFSVAEKELARLLTKLQRQMYIFFKYILWRDAINSNKTLSSYHLKTAFFWLMEDLPSSTWKEENLADIFHLLIEKMSLFLLEGNWPSYFVPTNNMIGHMKKEDLEQVKINLLRAKEDFLSCILSCSSGTNLLILEGHIFKSVFSPVFAFLQIDKGLFKGKGIDGVLGNSLDDEWMSDDMLDDEMLEDIFDGEMISDEGSENEIDTQISSLRADEGVVEREEGKGREFSQNKGASSGECEGKGNLNSVTTEQDRNKPCETERFEQEKIYRVGNEDGDKKQDDTIGCMLRDKRHNFDKKGEAQADETGKNIKQSGIKDSDENKTAEINLLSRYNKAKATCLLKLAKIYQVFHSYDFSVQILKELYKQCEEDELTLTSFITEASLKGVPAKIEAIQNTIELHEYLLSSSFPNNENINLALAHLHLCLASVLEGTDGKKALEAAHTYLDANKEPSVEGDILRARIQAAQGQYESAQGIIADAYLIMKESKECMYVSINPVEYMSLPGCLRDIIADFTYDPDCPTNIPVNLHVLFLMAYYQSKLGMAEGVNATCKEFNSQLKHEKMDVDDQELGKAMYDILLSFEHKQW